MNTLEVSYSRDWKATQLPSPPSTQYLDRAGRHRKSLEVRSKHLDSSQWSKRQLTARLQPNRGTIVNTREAIGRNARVSVAGAPPVKLKRSSLARMSVPTEIR